MKLDEPHHYERAVTVGVTHADDEKQFNISLDSTVLHVKLNDAQAKFIAEELQQ